MMACPILGSYLESGAFQGVSRVGSSHHKQMFRLEVPVQHSPPMTVGDTIQELEEEVGSMTRFQGETASKVAGMVQVVC